MSQSQLPNQAPARNGRLEDSLYPALLAAAAEQRARPISWHPSSVQAPPNMASQGPSNASWQVPAYGNVPAGTFDNTSSENGNGLLGPLSYPDPSEDMFPPQYLDGHQTYPAYTSPSHLGNPSNQNTIPLLMNSIDPSYYSFSLQPPQHNPSPYSQQSPQFSMASGMPERGDTAYYSSRSSAASLTPDVLPIQKFDDEPPTPPSLPQKPEALGDELVGMGLYDEPESPASYDPEHEFMMRADGTVVPVPRPAGKGLKLEETFVPSNTEGSDGPNSEESGEAGKASSSVDANSDSHRQQPQATENPQVIPDSDGGWFGNINGDKRPMPTLEGSFYFDNGDNAQSEYLKPMMFSDNMYANSNPSASGYGWI